MIWMKESEKHLPVRNKLTWLWVRSRREYGRTDGEARWVSFFRHIYQEEICKEVWGDALFSIEPFEF